MTTAPQVARDTDEPRGEKWLEGQLLLRIHFLQERQKVLGSLSESDMATLRGLLTGMAVARPPAAPKVSGSSSVINDRLAGKTPGQGLPPNRATAAGAPPSFPRGVSASQPPGFAGRPGGWG